MNPEAEHAFAANRAEQLAIRAEGHAGHADLLVGEHGQLLAGHGVPGAHRAVGAAAGQRLAIAAPGHRVHGGGVALQLPGFLSRHHIVNLYLVADREGDLLAVGTEGDGHRSAGRVGHDDRRPAEADGPQQSAGAAVPQLQGPFPAGGGEPSAVRTEGDVVDPLGVPHPRTAIDARDMLRQVGRQCRQRPARFAQQLAGLGQLAGLQCRVAAQGQLVGPLQKGRRNLLAIAAAACRSAWNSACSRWT